MNDGEPELWVCRLALRASRTWLAEPCHPCGIAWSGWAPVVCHGSAAVGSYGPLLRFIAGAGYAARNVTRVARRSARTADVVGARNLAVSAERV